MIRISLLLLLIPSLTMGQKKNISLEDIFKKGTFKGEAFDGFSRVEKDSLFKATSLYDAEGKKIETGNYQFSPDKKTVLFINDQEPIYRRSSKSTVYIYDMASKQVSPLNKGKVLHATFSPDGSKLAYVADNNLFLYDFSNNTSRPITSDGKWNLIINGNCDWVYEEEFSFSKAFVWSPDSKYIAYYKFDESKVKEYAFTLFDSSYNKLYSYKYPKAGEENSKVEIHFYNLATQTDIKADFETGDIYIPRIKWTPTNDKLIVFWMNRHQDDLKLLMTDPASGQAQDIYEEKNKYYIDITDEWFFLKNGKDFLFTSEMNGYNQLYHYSFDGKKKIQISTLKFDVAEVNGVDEKNNLVYYTLAYPTPMDRNLFVSDFEGRQTRPLTTQPGWHRVEFNSSFTQFYDSYSNLNSPPVSTLYSISEKNHFVTSRAEKIAQDSKKLNTILEQYNMGRAEFIKVPNGKGDTLNGWMLKPSNFNTQKKYPVLFCNYGGPGSQQVANRYGSVNMWHQMLCENGFIVVSIDNTGTGFRGEEFKKKTYLQLGKYEIEDQIDAAKYLSGLPYIDKNRIGHWGWSFGGFMSALAITKGADVFKAAVSVAPVTSWRFYDNIYTERYMRTPKENAHGYDDNSPINFTNLIKGKFLLIHGTADDNVHFQNSVEMIKSLVKHNIDFESAYYPNKNHGISGFSDNTTYHLWSKMTNWIYQNLRDNIAPIDVKSQSSNKSF
ncbi:MAG: S9 family peptidase [Flavisolibacter sp.]